MDTLERRREQNRAAQRRFRERQKSVAIIEHPRRLDDERTHSSPSTQLSATTSTFSQHHNSGSSHGLGGTCISPETIGSTGSVPSATFSATPSSSLAPAANTPTGCSDFHFYGTNLLFDNIGGVDMGDITGPNSSGSPLTGGPQAQQFADMIEELGYLDIPVHSNYNGDVLTLGANPLAPPPSKAASQPRNNARTFRQQQRQQQQQQSQQNGATKTGPSEEDATEWSTPLHVAAVHGRDKIITALLQHGADCNAKDSNGLTPLAHAAMNGHKEIVRLLLSHGARVSEVDDQRRTVLHWAVIRQREGVLKVLWEHCGREHVLIDRYDNTGRAPVHISIETGFEEGVRLLLDFGANVNLKMRKNTAE